MTQAELIFSYCKKNPSAIIISSLGTISYDLKEIEHQNKILIKGAMGSALGCGLGYALGAPDKKVIVFIGEGSLLMKLGSLATYMEKKPPNLEVIVVVNNKYRSCGGQENYWRAIEAHLPVKQFVVDEDIHK